MNLRNSVRSNDHNFFIHLLPPATKCLAQRVKCDDVMYFHFIKENQGKCVIILSRLIYDTFG